MTSEKDRIFAHARMELPRLSLLFRFKTASDRFLLTIRMGGKRG